MNNPFEYQLLSTICNDPGILVNLEINQTDFSDSDLARVFEEVTTLINAHKIPDPIMLAEILSFDSNKNWMPLISDIFTKVPISANAQSMVAHIKRAHVARDAKAIAFSLMQDSDSDPSTAMTGAINSLKTAMSTSAGDVVRVIDALPAVLERLDDLQSGKVDPGIKTGVTRLDDVMGGFQPSDLIVIGARPGVGKTAVMVNFVVNGGVAAGVISAEQPVEQITQRMLAKIGQISGQNFRTGKLSPADMAKIPEATKKLSKMPIYVYDKSMPTIDDVEQKARRLVWDHDIKILYIDYLQYIRSDKFKERYMQVGDITARLKGLAKELDIPIVALAQLNRDTEGRKPRPSDLRESGSIEQDADQIILLHRDEDKDDELQLDLAKNRHGPQGFTIAGWIPETMTLTNKTGANY